MADGRQRTFLAATAMFWFAMYTYPVLLSNFTTETLGGTPAMAGLVVGSYGFTQMLLRIPVGFASDRLRRRKPFLIAGAVCTLAAALGLLLAQGAAAALLARGTAGVAASTWVCFTVLFGSYQSPARRAQAMGTLSSVMYAAQLVATLLGGALARQAGVRASFVLAAAAGIVAVLCAARVKDEPPKAAPVGLAAVGSVLRSRRLLYCAGLSILMQMIMWATLYGFSPGWAEHVLGADPAQLGLLSTVHLIPTILFSRLGASRLAPRLGTRVTVMLGFACLMLGCTLMAFTMAFWQMLCLQALCGVGIGCAAPLLLALCNRDVVPAYQGIAMGAYQSLYGIGMFVGPMLAGWLVETVSAARGQAAGYQAVFFCAGALALLAVLGGCKLPGREAA